MVKCSRCKKNRQLSRRSVCVITQDYILKGVYVCRSCRDELAKEYMAKLIKKNEKRRR